MNLVNDDGEPLTANDFILKLSAELEERVWTETSERNCNRGCCGSRTFNACNSCGAEEGDDYRHVDFRKHKEGCQLETLLLQTDAFLRVEEELQRLREERESGEALPHHPH